MSDESQKIILYIKKSLGVNDFGNNKDLSSLVRSGIGIEFLNLFYEKKAAYFKNPNRIKIIDNIKTFNALCKSLFNMKSSEICDPESIKNSEANKDLEKTFLIIINFLIKKNFTTLSYDNITSETPNTSPKIETGGGGSGGDKLTGFLKGIEDAKEKKRVEKEEEEERRKTEQKKLAVKEAVWKQKGVEKKGEGGEDEGKKSAQDKQAEREELWKRKMQEEFEKQKAREAQKAQEEEERKRKEREKQEKWKEKQREQLEKELEVKRKEEERKRLTLKMETEQQDKFMRGKRQSVRVVEEEDEPDASTAAEFVAETTTAVVSDTLATDAPTTTTTSTALTSSSYYSTTPSSSDNTIPASSDNTTPSSFDNTTSSSTDVPTATATTIPIPVDPPNYSFSASTPASFSPSTPASFSASTPASFSASTPASAAATTTAAATTDAAATTTTAAAAATTTTAAAAATTTTAAAATTTTAAAVAATPVTPSLPPLGSFEFEAAFDFEPQNPGDLEVAVKQVVYVDDLANAKETQWAVSRTYSLSNHAICEGIVPFTYLKEIGTPYTATATFVPENDGDLPFHAGETVYIEDVARATQDQWGIARKYTHTSSGRMEIGMVPFTYLTPVDAQ